jgi:hypothetical protein
MNVNAWTRHLLPPAKVLERSDHLSPTASTVDGACALQLSTASRLPLEGLLQAPGMRVAAPPGMQIQTARSLICAAASILVISCGSPQCPGDADAASDGGSGGGEGPGAGGGAGASDGGAEADAGADVQDSGCIHDSDPFDVALLKEQISFLASEALDGRKPGTPGDLAARKYVEDRLECLGLLPGGTNGSFEQPVTDIKGAKTANVIALIPGSDPIVGSEIIGVGAHLDHFGNGRLGANDNASGVVGVLSIAQALKQAPTPPKRTVVVLFWASEEVDFDGSKHFVNEPTELPQVPLAQFVYYVNFDMIGSYTMNGNEVDASGTVGTTPALPVLRSLLASQADLNVVLEIEGDGADDSDYYQLCKVGVPFVNFAMEDPLCYHKACDKAGRIDYANMSRVVELSSDLVRALADTSVDLATYRAQTKVADLGCGD